MSKSVGGAGKSPTLDSAGGALDCGENITVAEGPRR
jgi:hypothetical protein